MNEELNVMNNYYRKFWVSKAVHCYNKRERKRVEKKQKREIEDKRLNSWFACAENLMQMSAVI